MRSSSCDTGDLSLARRPTRGCVALWRGGSKVSRPSNVPAMRPLLARLVLSVAVGAAVLTGCGGGSSTQDVSGTDFTVHAKDTLKFDKSAYTAKAGDINIGYANDGSMTHTLLVAGQNGFKLQVDGSTKTTSGKINLPPGQYTLLCDIAGHEAAGMKATLTVS